MSKLREQIEFLDELIGHADHQIDFGHKSDQNKWKNRKVILTEIKGTVKNPFDLKGICRWWIETYPEDVFPCGWIAEVRDYFQAILNGKCTITEQPSPPDDDLVWKILKIGFKCGFESGEAEENRVRNKKAKAEIHKLLQGRQPEKLKITREIIKVILKDIGNGQVDETYIIVAFRDLGFDVDMEFEVPKCKP